MVKLASTTIAAAPVLSSDNTDRGNRTVMSTISPTSNEILLEPLVSIFTTFLQTICTTTTDTTETDTTALLSLSDAVDVLEISLRKACFDIIKLCISGEANKKHIIEVNPKSKTADAVYIFWYHSLLTISWFMEQFVNTTSTDTRKTISVSARTTTTTIESDIVISRLKIILTQLSSYTTTLEYPTTLQVIRHHEQYNTMISHLRKVPLLLLEDITDLLSLSDAYQFWSKTLLYPIVATTSTESSSFAVLSSSTSVDETKPSNNNHSAYNLFFSDLLWYTNRHSTTTTTTASSSNPSWLLFLKISNKFIRRLQQSSGRTLTSSSSSSQSSQSSIIISQILQLLSTIYSMTERSSTRVWGSYNEHKVVTAAVTQTIGGGNTESILPVASDNTNGKNNNSNNNDLYSIFWKLQDDFRHPNGIIVSDFIQRLQFMLRIMESSTCTRRQSSITPTTTNHAMTHIINETVTMKQPNEKSGMTTTSLDELQHDMNLHILSNPFCVSSDSRLISIQLQEDATIRNIIILQMYMVLHHLLIQVPLLRTQLQTHLQTLGSIVRDSDSNCRTFVEKALYLLNHSELDWRQWKQNKCLPDIEQPRQRPVMDSKLLSTRKRKRFDNKVNTHTNAVVSSWTTENDEILTLMDISTKMRTKYVPTIQDHCQDYVEALDPEAGIDDEYHPKNDTMFNWQALRLFAFHDRTDMKDEEMKVDSDDDNDDDDYLSNFKQILPNGDYENMIRHVYKVHYGTVIPGDGPKPYCYVQEETLENIENKEDAPDGITGKTEDQNMKNASNSEKEIEGDKTDVEMAEIKADLESNKEIVPSGVDNESNTNKGQTNTTNEVQYFTEPSNAENNISEKSVEPPKNVPPADVSGLSKADARVPNPDEKRGEQPAKKIATNSVSVENLGTTRNGDSHANAATKVPPSQRQASTTAVGGNGAERNNATRPNYPIGPSPQFAPKPREGTVERSHDTYSRSRHDGYNSSSGRSYHPMDHGGRSSRDAIVKDHVSTAPSGRSRDDMPRGGQRDEHHRQPVSGDGSRWDGGEWRTDSRGPPVGPDYHHVRGGLGSNLNSDRNRDHNRGNAGSGTSSNRPRNTGSTWPRDGDGSTRR